MCMGDRKSKSCPFTGQGLTRGLRRHCSASREINDYDELVVRGILTGHPKLGLWFSIIDTERNTVDLKLSAAVGI